MEAVSCSDGRRRLLLFALHSGTFRPLHLLLFCSTKSFLFKLPLSVTRFLRLHPALPHAKAAVYYYANEPLNHYANVMVPTCQSGGGAASRGLSKVLPSCIQPSFQCHGIFYFFFLLLHPIHFFCLPTVFQMPHILEISSLFFNLPL